MTASACRVGNGLKHEVNINGRHVIVTDELECLGGAPCAVAIASRGYADHLAPLAKVGVGPIVVETSARLPAIPQPISIQQFSVHRKRFDPRSSGAGSSIEAVSP